MSWAGKTAMTSTAKGLFVIENGEPQHILDLQKDEVSYSFWNGGVSINDNSGVSACVLTDLVNGKAYKSTDKRLMYNEIMSNVRSCYCGLEVNHKLLLSVMGKD